MERAESQAAHWSVCQVLSTRAHLIQREVSARHQLPTLVPMMRSKRLVDGQLSDTAKPAMPGYMFVWGASGSFYSRDGRTVIARTIGRLSEAEYHRIVSDNAAGRHDEIDVEVAPVRRRVRRRRPRAGKRYGGAARIHPAMQC